MADDNTAQDEYLQSVLQGAPAPADASPAPADAPAAPTDNAQPTQVAGVDVAAQRPQGLNFQAPDSVADANNVRQALQNPAYQPQGGGANPGVWGLLPQNMQHGTLRNVLGALGDAFLVGSGHQTQYEPRMERQQEGLAMSDYAEHPEFAINRMAATGTPDAMKNAVALQENQNNVDMHKDQLASQQQYRQDRTDQIAANNASLAAAREANAANQRNSQLRQFMPQVGGMMNSATDQATYATRYQQADNLAKRFGGTAADFGLVPPEMWTKDMAPQGVTAGQQVNSQDKAAGRATSERDTDVRAGATIRAAGIGAGQRANTAAQGMGANDARIMRDASDKGVQNLTAADQARYTYLTTKGSGAAKLTIPGLTVGAGAKGAGGNAQYSQIHTYPSGRKAGWNGKQWVPIN